jgi:hypothetical protein
MDLKHILNSSVPILETSEERKSSPPIQIAPQSPTAKSSPAVAGAGSPTMEHQIRRELAAASASGGQIQPDQKNLKRRPSVTAEDLRESESGVDGKPKRHFIPSTLSNKNMVPPFPQTSTNTEQKKIVGEAPIFSKTSGSPVNEEVESKNDAHSPRSMSSDEDEIENRLLEVEDHSEIYTTSSSAKAAQLAYLSEHAPKMADGMSVLSPKDFRAMWDGMNGQGKLAIAGMYEGAIAIELTSPGSAVGSENAGPCLLGFARGTLMGDKGKKRIFGAAIHVDPADMGGIDFIDIVQSYQSVFKSLSDSLLSKEPEISDIQYSLYGCADDDDNPESLRLAAAVVHAARNGDINVVDCRLPMNNKDEVTSALMTKDNLLLTQENLAEDESQKL